MLIQFSGLQTTDTMVINDLSITFAPHQVLKHSRPGRNLDVFEYRSYYDKNYVLFRA